MKLPLLDARLAETTLCTYCPKLCRPTCPVSNVEGRETVTPWGKMRAAGEITRRAVPLEPARTSPSYACTGCMRCTTMCDLDNPVADSLRDARATAFEGEAAPAEASAFVQGFPERERALESAARELAPPGSVQGARAALFPGCTSVMFERDDVTRIHAAFSTRFGACELVAGSCCGLPLLEAGDRAGFARHASSLAGRLASFDRVVVEDAGCAHAMRVLMPRFGVKLPRVLHTAELVAGSLASLPTLDAPRSTVAYHDACRLGRGLGVYDEPRAVLTRLLGRAPIELAESREHGLCSGAGALLSKTRPATSRAIGDETAQAVRDAGATTVVSACAASRRQFARAGLDVVGLGALVARAIDAQR